MYAVCVTEEVNLTRFLDPDNLESIQVPLLTNPQAISGAELRLSMGSTLRGCPGKRLIPNKLETIVSAGGKV